MKRDNSRKISSTRSGHLSQEAEDRQKLAVGKTQNEGGEGWSFVLVIWECHG